jgi:uncharacterized membrane protein YgcG
MDGINSAFAVALERALIGDRQTPLTKDELISKSHGEIEKAIRAAMRDPALLQSLASPEMPTQLMLDMAREGKSDLLLGALQHRADVNARTSKGETALILAARARSAPCVKLLLSARADVTASAPGVGTALHVAAGQGDEAVALHLIDAGSDPFTRNHEGLDPNHRGLDALELMRAEHLTPYRVFAHYAAQLDERAKAARRLACYVAGNLPSAYVTSHLPSACSTSGKGDDEGSGGGGGGINSGINSGGSSGGSSSGGGAVSSTLSPETEAPCRAPGGAVSSTLSPETEALRQAIQKITLEREAYDANHFYLCVQAVHTRCMHSQAPQRPMHALAGFPTADGRERAVAC